MIHGLILAAGKSQRFGEDKLLFSFKGKPLILHSLEIFKPVINSLHVVVNDDNAILSGLLIENGYNTISCPESGNGLGNSFACGIQATSNADGWIISLGDMPFIRQDTVAKVYSAMVDGQDIVVPCHHARRGHPVGFSKNLFKDLSCLSGETGGSKVIQQNIDKIYWLDVDDPGVLMDVDTQDDLYSHTNKQSTNTRI